MYNVVFHNDDVTTMDFVIEVLMKFYRKTFAEAEALMLKVDREGEAVAGTYYKDIAETKCVCTLKAAREQGFPLQVTVEEAK